MNAAGVVDAELVKHWIWSNVYPTHQLTVAKIFSTVTEFKAVFLEHHNKLAKPNELP